MRTAAFSFIGLDDAAYTFRNPFVAGGLTFPNVVETFTNLRHGGIWMPLTYLSYMADVSFCRVTGIPLIGWMHLVNVLLHIANVLLLWKLLCLLFLPPTIQQSSTQTIKHSNTPTLQHSPPSPPTIKQSNNQTIKQSSPSSPPTIKQSNNPTIQQSNNPPLSPLCLLAALIWAVHPLRVEPVAWIACRKELLWSFLALAGLICWCKALVSPRPTAPSSPLSTLHPPPSTLNSPLTTFHSPLTTLNSQLSTLLFCALACLAKPTAMCFPLLALLVAWRRGCFPLVHNGANPSTPPPLTPSNNPTLPLLLTCFSIAAITAAVAAYSQTHVAGQETVALYAAPLAHRLVNALSAIGFYLRVTIWPFGLHVDCRAVPGLWPLDAGWNLAVLGVALASLGAWVVRAAQRRRAHTPQPLNSTPQPLNPSNTFFALAWFIIALLPTLGLLGSFGIEAHADRFTYLPSMAFSFLIAGFFAVRHEPVCKPNGTTGDRQPGSFPLKPFNHLTFNLLIVITILLSVLTFNQLAHWRDDATAHRRALACDPEHPRALVHVADARCSRQHDFDGGIRLYRQALARADTMPPGGFNVDDVKAKLAYALATRGRREDFAEVKRLGEAVLREPRLDRRGLMLDALGTAFLHEGERERAAAFFRASIDAPDRFWPKASTRHKLDSCFAR